MLSRFLKYFFGSENERTLKRVRKTIEKINSLEDHFSDWTAEQFKERTVFFRAQLDKKEATLEDLLPEAYAMVREASQRVLGMRHYDCQLVGGIILHEGSIAEMRTGEGKTLVATLPAYLNALVSSVHIITVNDYLANRDAEWMAPLYQYLGLTVGVVYSNQPQESKHESYQSDIIYGTNNEFGFDYLRDNMVVDISFKNQRKHSFAIIDEVDSILIDEARTPLIISGPAEESSGLYEKVRNIVSELKFEYRDQDQEKSLLPNLESDDEEEEDTVDFYVIEKNKQVELTDSGHSRVEEILVQESLLAEGDSLYAAGNLNLMHYIDNALRAETLYKKDVDYIVDDNQIVLIDEHTGRKMLGRRLADGLHQAIEAKESLGIQRESMTLASITFQNYFRIYDKLAGMTGTADTEAFEFHQIYGLKVTVIPTNKPVIREDKQDLIFMTLKEKLAAIVDDIREIHATGAPVLVGTTSIENSEVMSNLLKKAKIKHQVLNAKYHEKEAEIIAQAGSKSSVTIATNMAGRGSDIVLGGNPYYGNKDKDLSLEQKQQIEEQWNRDHKEVCDLGGLHIIGTERHESRRIDNQLRGRSGRQGDPGSTQFYLSLEDKLVRLFASERMIQFMQKLGVEEGEAITHSMVTRSIEKAQKKVEGYYFDIRRQLLKYDDIANEQRKFVYSLRDNILKMESLDSYIEELSKEVLENQVITDLPSHIITEKELDQLLISLKNHFHIELSKESLGDIKSLNVKDVIERVQTIYWQSYGEKLEIIQGDKQPFQRQFILRVMDHLWKEYLSSLQHLRQGINLRAYAQKDPQQEYKREAMTMFQDFLLNYRYDVITNLAKVRIRTREEAQQSYKEEQEKNDKMLQSIKVTGSKDIDEGSVQPIKKKIGRNDLCFCNSGKKYKRCCGRLDKEQ